MEINPKFNVGEMVVSKYKDDWDQFKGEGEVEEVIVSVRYKVKFHNERRGKFLEEELKRA